MAQVERVRGNWKGAAAGRVSTGIGAVRAALAARPSRFSRADIAAVSMYCAPVFLALFTFGYALRGGMLLFGAINLTLVFLLATVFCVGVHLPAAKQIRFQLIWADLALAGLAAALLANSSSSAGLEKGLRFVALVLAPYFLARVILVDFARVKRFLITILTAVTILGAGAFAYSAILPDKLAELLPYAVTEWNQRLVFLKVNPVQLGMLFVVGTMAYVGLISGWRRIWIIPGLAMIGVLLYNVLIVGTRASLVAILGISLISILIALVTRRYSNIGAMLIVFVTTGFIFYTVFTSALAPPTPTSTTTEQTVANDPPPGAAVLPAPTSATAADDVARDAPGADAAAPPTAEQAAANDPPLRMSPPPVRIKIPNQERFESLALAFKSLEDETPEKKKLAEQTIQNRMKLIEEALTNFKNNPLLGGGTAVMEDYAHNIFLETAAELGLLGLVLLSIVLVFALRSLWKFYVKLDERNPCFHIVTTVFLVVGALFIQKQFSTNLADHKDLIVFVAIIFNLPLILGMPGREAGGGLRERLPPRFRFLAPAEDSVPVDDEKVIV